MALVGIGSVERALADIARATQEQAKGTSQVSQGLNEIEDLTRQNSQNAQDGADAAATIAHKTLELKDVLDPFTFVRNGNGRNGNEQAFGEGRLTALVK